MSAKTNIGYISEIRTVAGSVQKLQSACVLFLELLFSIGIPLLGLLIYMTYAEANGIKLEKGCEGPGVPFSMLSGFIFALIQRIKCK